MSEESPPEQLNSNPQWSDEFVTLAEHAKCTQFKWNMVLSHALKKYGLGEYSLVETPYGIFIGPGYEQRTRPYTRRYCPQVRRPRQIRKTIILRIRPDHHT